MEKVVMIGMMGAVMRAIYWKVFVMEMEFIKIQMKELSMTANGETGCVMVEVLLSISQGKA